MKMQLKVKKIKRMIDKFIQKNRNGVFLIATILIGALLIGGLFMVDESSSSSEDATGITSDQYYKEIEKEIEGLKSKKFDANAFNVISAKINASYNTDLITITAKNYLRKKLATIYSGLVYAQCESFLTNNKGNSAELVKWLNQIKSLSANDKTNFYLAQIKWYNYYSVALPAKVNAFISPGISNYEDSRYLALKTEVENMPNLDRKYKNNSKFINIKSRLVGSLKQFNYEFYE
jgi:hypothetical protein